MSKPKRNDVDPSKFRVVHCQNGRVADWGPLAEMLVDMAIKKLAEEAAAKGELVNHLPSEVSDKPVSRA